MRSSAEHHARIGEILITEELRSSLGGSDLTTPCGLFPPVCRVSASKCRLPPRLIFPPDDLEISRIFLPEEVIAQDVRGEFRQVVNLFMRFPDLSNDQLRDSDAQGL